MGWLTAVKDRFSRGRAVKCIKLTEGSRRGGNQARATSRPCSPSDPQQVDPLLPGAVLTSIAEGDETGEELGEAGAAESELRHGEDGLLPVPAAFWLAVGAGDEAKAPLAKVPQSRPPDGLWRVVPEAARRSPAPVAPWLMQFVLRGGSVIDGEGMEMPLKRRQGETLLARGVLTFDGVHLHRVGKSGFPLTFAWVGPA